MYKGCFICRKPADKVFILKTEQGNYKLCRKCMALCQNMFMNAEVPVPATDENTEPTNPKGL